MRPNLPTATLTLVLTIMALTAPVSADESEFIFVDRMPDIRGELKRRIAHQDQKSSQRTVQTMHAEDFAHAIIETYVLTVTCAAGAADKALEPYLVAVKYPPKKPSTFAVATLHDIYKEVYVLDRSGRIRLYENIAGQSMLTLSERFKPVCLPI